ncbi:hypothetical protein F2Q68_00044818 [Brassica cretica]|uniref:Uncharacterized protein n=1 Tax=Brassica cretica TaxID=69181 RepID=A0A8S9LLG0_BRACR|nr:hypothetical protein F2Q68_00044818 [Brassica cretica]
MVIGRKVSRRFGRASASARRSFVRESLSPDPPSLPSESFNSIHCDQFDSMYETNPGRIELFEDLSLDKLELEIVMFHGTNEDKVEDDVTDL